MKTITKLLGVALVGMLTFTGFAVASSGAGMAAADAPMTNAADDEERLEMFQERFDLTDEEVAEIQTAVETERDADASQEEIRATMTEKLEEFGVDDPAFGPAEDRRGTGPHGQMAGNGEATGNGVGNGQGTGPNGPADGFGLA